MTETLAVSAAQRNRLVQDALRIRDQERARVVETRERLLAEVRQRADLVEAQNQLDAQRLRTKREDLDFEQAIRDEVAEQVRVNDTIANDVLFQRTQDVIEDELNAARDGRELDESLLLRDLEGQRNEAAELLTLDQRAQDLRQALIEREARIVERRADERAEDIRQEANLRSSLERVREAPQRPQDAARGSIVDVGA